MSLALVTIEQQEGSPRFFLAQNKPIQVYLNKLQEPGHRFQLSADSSGELWTNHLTSLSFLYLEVSSDV